MLGTKFGGYGREIITWSNPEDLVFIVRNDVGAFLDVNLLATVFNIDKSVLLGNIIYVNNFDQFDEDGKKIFDGSKIVGMLADKSWFRIKEQDAQMDEFYNANNRTWQYYYNVTRMYNYSLFSNAVVFATEQPNVPITSMNFAEPEVEITLNESKELKLVTEPFNTTDEITFSTTDTAVTIEQIDNKTVKVTGAEAGTATIIATAGNLTAEATITVTP